MRSSSLFEKSDFRDSTNRRNANLVCSVFGGIQLFVGKAVH
jgi:hypothetical protein